MRTVLERKGLLFTLGRLDNKTGESSRRFVFLVSLEIVPEIVGRGEAMGVRVALKTNLEVSNCWVFLASRAITSNPLQSAFLNGLCCDAGLWVALDEHMGEKLLGTLSVTTPSTSSPLMSTMVWRGLGTCFDFSLALNCATCPLRRGGDFPGLDGDSLLGLFKWRGAANERLIVPKSLLCLFARTFVSSSFAFLVG